MPSTEALKVVINRHLKKIADKNDDKHTHKKMVLNAALDFLDKKIKFKALLDTVHANPLFNKSIGTSETQRLLFEVAKFIPDSTGLDINNRQELLLEIQIQLNALAEKDDVKHQHKKVVLEETKKVLLGESSLDKLDEVISKNKLYNKAFFPSVTDALVKRAELLVGPELDEEMKDLGKN